MVGGLLRQRQVGKHAPVGFVELFFDLVFVFAITQISHTLLAHLTPLGALQAAMLLAAVWWAWIDTGWITNWLDPDRPAVRVMLFCLMGLGLVMSTSLPEAFGEKGLWFAIAFVTLQVGRGLFTLFAVRGDPDQARNFQRICIWAMGAGVFWIAGGLSSGQTRMALWAVALACEFAGPALFFHVPGLGRSQLSDWTIEGGHLAERVGLFVIICLGESVLITGATFAGLDWTPQVVAAFLTAFVGSLAMWWIYFSAAHEAASEIIAHAADPGKLARKAYTYCPIIIVAGIIVSAVGDELSLAHPSGHLGIATAAVVIGGPLLFMLGGLLATKAVFGKWSVPRLLGAIALALLWFAVPVLKPLALAMCTTGMLVAVAAWETFAKTRGAVYA